jgi:hypothetical protein
MGLMSSKALWLTLTSGGAAASIILSPETVLDTAVGGDLVGTLSVIGGRGTYTFSITADPDSKFDLDGTDTSLLEVEALATFSVGDSHSVTIEADNGIDAVISATFSVRVLSAATSAGEPIGLLLILTKAA